MHLLDGMRVAAGEDDIVVELRPVCGGCESGSRHLAQRMERRDVVQSLQDLEGNPADASDGDDMLGAELSHGDTDDTVDTVGTVAFDCLLGRPLESFPSIISTVSHILGAVVMLLSEKMVGRVPSFHGWVLWQGSVARALFLGPACTAVQGGSLLDTFIYRGDLW